MLDILSKELKDETLMKMCEKRYESSSSIWEKIKQDYKKYFSVWKNLPEWLDDTPQKRSHVRDPRQFIVMETVTNKVTAKPTKPNIVPANDTPESKSVAEDLSDFFLEMYDELRIRDVVKKALRYTFIAKLAVIGVTWNPEKKIYEFKAKDPRKVRFAKNASNEEDSEFAIEDVTEPILDVIAQFPAKKEKILELNGSITHDQALENNPEVEYKKFWIGNGYACVMKNEVLGRFQNPFFDFSGLKVTKREQKNLKQLNGKRRRARMTKLKMNQVGR